MTPAPPNNNLQPDTIHSNPSPLSDATATLMQKIFSFHCKSNTKVSSCISDKVKQTSVSFVKALQNSTF